MIVPNYSDLIGLPFRWWERRASSGGLSCVGLVLEMYRRAGIVARDPGDRTECRADIRAQWESVPLDELEPMDVITFVRPGQEVGGHVGLYVGNETVLHATEGRGTQEDNLAEIRHALRPILANRWKTKTTD